MDRKETIECQINCFSINHFYKTLDNKVIEFSTIVNVQLHLTNLFNKLTLNNLTDFTHLITFFILMLLHNVSKIGMCDLLYILTYYMLELKQTKELQGLLSNNCER